MADILHRIEATATPDQVYDALTTLDGLGLVTTDRTGLVPRHVHSDRESAAST